MPYCSPELVAGDDVTKLDKTKADIWALGVITFALVTGRLPFATPDAIVNDPPAFIAPPGQSAQGHHSSNGGVVVGGPGTWLLNACLNKDWRKRPST